MRGSQPSLGAGDESNQPSLTLAQDRFGGSWMVAGYADRADPEHTRMGLAVRTPAGAWRTLPPLAPDDGSFDPAGDTWLAAAPGGARAYYVSLLATARHPDATDEVAEGIALAVIDVSGGAPEISPPRRIDSGRWPGWDEPTVAVERPPGAVADTVIVAGTPIGPDYQDLIAILVSHDGGKSFHEAPPMLAPGAPGRIYHHPENTLVRPFLQQDPRPGEECHVWLAFGVYCPTALRDTPGVRPPPCIAEPDACRSLAESETRDCGETWSPPVFVAIDTGAPSGQDYRGFGYAVAGDGTRFAVFGDEDSENAPILLKRAAADARFPVTVTDGAGGGLRFGDGPLETIVAGPSESGDSVYRWRPTLATGAVVAAAWVEEARVAHATSVRYSLSPLSSPGWGPPRAIDPAAPSASCDPPFPEDDYMGATPDSAPAATARSFLFAWTEFRPCGTAQPRQIVLGEVE